MTILAKHTKDPGETFDYDITYPSGELPVGDALVSAQASVLCVTDPMDTALIKGVVSFTDRRSKTWLGAGTDQQDYLITVVAVSEGGRVLVDHFIVKVRGTTA